MPALSVIIPCFNEAEAIPATLPLLEQALADLRRKGLISGAQVIVVDDASDDASPSLLKSFSSVEVVQLTRRSGYGAALRAGFARASGEWIGFMDMDGTYDPRDLETLLGGARLGDADIIFGERFSSGTGMPALRSVGNIFFTWLVGGLYQSRLTDVCTGFRLFRRSLLGEVLDVPDRGLSYSLALTIRVLKNGASIRELPIRYHVRYGRSKLSVLLDGTRFLWTVVSDRLSPVSVARKPVLEVGRDE